MGKWREPGSVRQRNVTVARTVAEPCNILREAG